MKNEIQYFLTGERKPFLPYRGNPRKYWLERRHVTRRIMKNYKSPHIGWGGGGDGCGCGVGAAAGARVATPRN